MNHANSNSGKSKNGHCLNRYVKELFDEKFINNEVQSYVYEPRYSFPGYNMKQISPDGEIILNNGDIIVIDNTTSIRHDRIKQKQWDAFGVKKFFYELHPEKNVKYFIILPDINHLDNENTEYKAYLREKKKINNKNYYSEIDDILMVSNLLDMIEEKNHYK